MNINITIASKHCTVLGTPVIVCGNSDYTLTFDFDAEWNQVAEKTARFAYIREGLRRYQDVKLTGNTVAVPAVYGTRELLVGVYAADIVTSTPARIPCEKSIICCSKAPEDLYPGQYEQLRTEITDYLDGHVLPVMVSAKGNFVRADDTPDLPIHALALTDCEEGLNTVDVSVYGKNLANINSVKRTADGMTYQWENSTLTIWGTGTNTSGSLINSYGAKGDTIILLPAGTYTVSTYGEFSNGMRVQIGKRVNNSFVSINNVFGNDPNDVVTFTLEEPTLIVFRMYLPTGVVVDESNPDIVSLQIEAGPKATGFETPIIPQTATIDTATQTGWENLRTNYGTTTIIPASGTVECTYVADTKLYIDNKFNELSTALLALGGS